MALDGAWRAERDERGIWTLWFDRPGSRQNALDGPALVELEGHVRAIAADPAASGLILRSAKPRGFCAGADLKAIRACRLPEEVAAFARLGQRAFAALADLAIPKVALVHGACLGGGLELALACGPIAALDDDAVPLRIGTPEVTIGLVPAWGAIDELPQRLGIAPALDLLLGGEPLDADRAARLGLVAMVDSADAVDPRAMTLSARAGADPTGWLATIERRRREESSRSDPAAEARRFVLAILETGLCDGRDAALDAAADALGRLAFEPAGRAALDAFAERSAPGGQVGPG